MTDPWGSYLDHLDALAQAVTPGLVSVLRRSLGMRNVDIRFCEAARLALPTLVAEVRRFRAVMAKGEWSDLMDALAVPPPEGP